MAVTGKWYGQAFNAAFNKEIDFNSDTIKAMLTTSSYAYNSDTHNYKDDVTNEVTGTGYTATGKTMTTAAIAFNSGTHKFSLDADDLSWTGLTVTGARVLVIYDATPATDATRPLIAYVDFGADKSPANEPLNITFDANGIATVTIS